MRCNKRPYENVATFVFNTKSTAFNPKDQEMMKELKSKNFSLVYQHFLKLGDKEKALEVLLKQEKWKFNIPVVEEVIRCYLYFEDYEGALDYIEKTKVRAPKVVIYEYLIKIHQASKEKDSRILEIVKEALGVVYDRRFVEFMLERYTSQGTGTSNECLREGMEEIQNLIVQNHLKELSYDEAKYLYRTMPNKGVFLSRMVEMNPKIKKKYYLEHAELHGIKRVDIERILKAHFRTWALEIALFFGWVDSSFKESMEKCVLKVPVSINKEGKWGEKNVKYRFKKGLE